MLEIISEQLEKFVEIQKDFLFDLKDIVDDSPFAISIEENKDDPNLIYNIDGLAKLYLESAAQHLFSYQKIIKKPIEPFPIFTITRLILENSA